MIEVRIDNAVFFCDSPEEAVEVASLWREKRQKNGRLPLLSPSSAGGNPSSYQSATLRFLLAVNDAGDQGAEARSLLRMVGDPAKSAGMGTFGAMARKILRAKGFEFERVLVRQRKKFEGRDTKLWLGGPDLGAAIEKLRSENAKI